MIDKTHYNYIIIGKSNQGYTLLNENSIQKIYAAFSPLSQSIDTKKVRISTIQYAKGENIKIGRPKWTISDLEALTTKYKSYPVNNFRTLLLKAEFPSVASAYKKGATSEIVLTIVNDYPWGKEYNTKECGLVLSIREDIYEKIGEASVHSFLKQITSLLDESKIMFKKRKYLTSGIKEVSMMDILPNSPKDYFKIRK